MKNISKFSHRRSFICSAVLLALTPTQLLAQEQNTDEETQNVEVINITGSHIRGVDLEGSQPLLSIDAADIANSGASSIAELLKTVGATRGGDGSFTTSESGGLSTSTPGGQASVSLRGMGPSSTLTLINGRRVAASSFAFGTQNFVDVNSIPLAAIERIEILPTGASATYGADAVAGVINYILKKDYEGAELDVSYGNSLASSDEGKASVNLIYGTKVGEGNLTLFADFYKREDFRATDRDYLAEPNLTSRYSYLPKLPYPNIYYNSSNVQDPDTGDYLEIANPNCQTELVTTEFNEEICAYYGNGDDVLRPEFESMSAGALFSIDIGDITWNTDLFFSSTTSQSQSSPAPINDLDDGEGAWVNYTVLPDAIPSADIYYQYYDTVLGREGDGFKIDARFSDPRTIDVDTTAIRLVSSLSGDFGDWFWETGVTYSRSESEQVATQGIYNRYKFSAATAGELCSTGQLASLDSNGEPVCTSGDLLPYFNPFLIGDADNDAILALAQERPTRDGESTLFGLDAKISGELFEFGDDYVRAAFGVEYRQEEITDVPSVNARANFENDYIVDVYGFGSSLSSADRTQFGAFAEFFIPLAEDLELQLAGRYDDYDDFGDTFNPKVAISYRPIDSLVIRGSWATSFRAPSLTQAGVELRTTTARFDCAGNQQVSDVYCDGLSYESSPNVLELGNPNLKAEESESMSVGFAFSPTDSFNVSVDYWHFDHENLVDTDLTQMMADALTDSSLRHCGVVPQGEVGLSFETYMCDYYTDDNGLILTDEGANIEQIVMAAYDFGDLRYPELAEALYRDHVIQLTNVGTQKLEGLDIKADYTLDLSADSELYFAFDATHYLGFERTKAGSSDLEELVGTYRYPETVASATIEYAQDNWFVGATLFHTGEYEDDIEGLRGRNLDELEALGELDADGGRQVDAWNTVRINGGLNFENYQLRLTINNITDEEPPTIYGSSRGFDSINHDALGTHYNLTFSYFF
ncbi:MAG: TonB-dependent receptor [Gammaproteobacteria bacterium]|nr:TonB-dependent receptor [Gammaproteobacteria bacterium]